MYLIFSWILHGLARVLFVSAEGVCLPHNIRWRLWRQKSRVFRAVRGGGCFTLFLLWRVGSKTESTQLSPHRLMFAWVKMVVLRSSGSVGAEPEATTPKRRAVDLDTSSEFLSLVPAATQRKSARSTRSSRFLNNSFSSPENCSVNVRTRTQTAGTGEPLVRGRKGHLWGCYFS